MCDNNCKDFDEVKLNLKKWETEFVRKHNAKPTKTDISSASQDIRDLYKSYWKLKNAKSEADSKHNGHAWGTHLNKKETKRVFTTENENVSILDRYTQKIKASQTTIKTTEGLTTHHFERSKIRTRNIEDDTSIDPGFKLVVRNKIELSNSQPISAVASSVGIRQIRRRLPINNDWLNRCENALTFQSSEHKNQDSVSKTDCVENSASYEFEESNVSSMNVVKTVELTGTDNYSNEMGAKSISPPRETLNESNEIDDISKEFLQAPKSDCSNSELAAASNSKSNKRQLSPSCTMPKKELLKSCKRLKVDTELNYSCKSIREKTQSEKTERKLKILEKKLKSGTANDNFVRIDIKKKIFLRGKKKFSAVKYKRKQWKQRQKSRDNDSEGQTISRASCFRCGEIGHWVKNCPKAKLEASTEDGFDFDTSETEESPFLTLEEAAALAKGITPKQLNDANCENNLSKNEPEPELDKPLDDQVLEEECSYSDVENSTIHRDSDLDTQQFSQGSAREPFEPLFDIDETENHIKAPDTIYKALHKFGYDNFRPGQENTIMRILSGLSTLLISSTGAGKSLCYQLPAYLYAKRSKCITLVISPLVSLMEDQVVDLPSCLRAVCIHTNLTSAQKEKACSAVCSGKVHVLLISPEMAVNVKGFLSLLRDLPPIAFACIDEAHCISEWSHNFRPSYLRLYKVLRYDLGVNCVLALTATATCDTANSIAKNLNISGNPSAVIRGPSLPNNLYLSVSRDEDKDEALLNLLRGNRFSDCHSIIIYCTRREQTDRLAALIRTCLQNSSNDGTSSGKRVAWSAEPYHAGLSAAKRRSVQNKFMTGKLRIVVATVAFGMGLDKSDVRAVIHYNMPRRFESYVQEIGRAGRDGKPAHCHLFLDPQGGDLCELRRHIYSNSIDRSTLRKLLRNVFSFSRCKCESTCKKHEIAVPVDKIVEELDLKEENIVTLLCYLELAPKRWIDILNSVYATCKIQCYSGSQQLKKISKECPPVGVAVALAMQKGKKFDKTNKIEFPVVAIASQMGWDSGIVKRELKALEWTSQSGRVKKSGVMVEFSDLSLHFRAPGNLKDTHLDEVLDYLHGQVTSRENNELKQLRIAYKAFYEVSKIHYWSCSDEVDEKRNETLKNYLRSYFDDKLNIDDDDNDCLPKDNSDKKEDIVRADIRNFISIYHEESFSGRSIARVFSGIGSPRYPAAVWGRVRRFWRSHLDVDFNLLCKWATQEIITHK